MPAQKLSEVAEEDGLENIQEAEKPTRVSLEALADDLIIRETPSQRLRRETLSPIVSFFIWSNGIIMFYIGWMSVGELIFHPHIITENVIISVVAGMTIQTAAIIIAAFKGLFSSPDD